RTKHVSPHVPLPTPFTTPYRSITGGRTHDPLPTGRPRAFCLVVPPQDVHILERETDRALLAIDLDAVIVLIAHGKAGGLECAESDRRGTRLNSSHVKI